MAYALSPSITRDEPSQIADVKNYSVYARLKPLDVNRVSDVLNKNNFMVSENKITTNHLNKKNEVLESGYKFNRVFMPSTPQEQIFEEVVNPRWIEFLNGGDSLIFSYGATNSGKSFTMQGTARQPGIIPRALYMTYKAIERQEDQHCPLMPFQSCQAFCPSQEERAVSAAEKRRILSTVATAHQESLDMSILAVPSLEMAETLDEMTEQSFDLQNGLVYSVWVSFVEIYNEKVFDLLTPEQSKLDSNLKLKRDEEDGCYFPEGVQQHLASSWEEAYDLYRYGIKNLHIASTRLNRKSSRSHCIFTIKLLTRSPHSEDTYNNVSSFSICDLAGTERMAHAEAEGTTRVRELQNINTSLLALNRCFVMLRSSQKNPKSEHVVPPYRESKLTLLFSKFLMGKGKLSMIANISQELSMFHQTEQVLKMTSIAYETRVKVKPSGGPRKARKMRFSLHHSHVPHSTPLAPPQHLLSQDHELRQKVEQLQLQLEQTHIQGEIERGSLLQQLQEVKAQFESFRVLHEQQVQEFEQLIHAESSTAARATHSVVDLEGKLRAKNREFSEMQFKWHDRLTAAVQKRDQLIGHIQTIFDLEDVVDPVMVVKRACFMYKDMKEAAEEEIGSLNEEISSLKQTLVQRNDEISLLKGKIIDLEEQKAFTEEYYMNMNKVREQELKNQQNAYLEEPTPAPTVKTHLNMSWVSDEESPLKLQLRRAKTTGKKKRLRRARLDSPATLATSADDNSPARRKARRKLLPRDEDHLGDGFAALDVTQPEEQPSPNSIMKSTLRSGRQRR